MSLDYWKECLSIAADEAGFKLTPEQLQALAEGAEGGHDNYGMAFYSPPAGDRIADIERGWKEKLDRLQKELDNYRTNAETAIKIALRQRSDANVSIREHGIVERTDGRTTEIQ